MKLVFTPLGNDEDILVLSAPSKKHVMTDLTSKLLISLDESATLGDWYNRSIMISGERISNSNFMNIDPITLSKLTKEHVREQIMQRSILGFGTIIPLKAWVDRNVKVYH